MATGKKFAIQQVFDIVLKDITTKKIIAYMNDLKSSGLENTVEMVYPTGGAGNVYIGGALAHSRRATLNVESATWNTEVMAAQNGEEIITGGVPSGSGQFTLGKYEIIECATQDTIILSQTAVGASGAEIGYAYILNEDGTFASTKTQTTAEQDGNPEAGTFIYTSSSKTLKFAPAEVAVGTKVAVYYEYASTADSELLRVNTDSIPKTALVTCFGIARDVCTGELFPCQVDGRVQIDGNYNLDLTADGDVVAQSVKMEFVRGCTGKKLYDFKITTGEN